ncbi:hypothetical protein ACTVH1_18315 [Gluconobacter cerinus]
MNRYLYPVVAVIALWVSSAGANDVTVCEIQPGLVVPAQRVDLQKSTTPWQCSLSRIVSDKSIQGLKKDEFETTKAFQERVIKALSEPVVGYNLSKPISLAVKASTYDVSYDADTERLTVGGSGEGLLEKLVNPMHHNGEPKTDLGISVPYILENGYTYDAVYMAQHPQIHRMMFETHAAIILHAPKLASLPIEFSKVRFLLAKVSPDKAKAIKENLYVLFSGTVSTSKPYALIDDGQSLIMPSVNERFVALYFQPGSNYAVVRGDTGEILASGPLK